LLVLLYLISGVAILGSLYILFLLLFTTTREKPRLRPEGRTPAVTYLHKWRAPPMRG